MACTIDMDGARAWAGETFAFGFDYAIRLFAERIN